MASAISYEYLVSIQGVADGLATLDGTGKVPIVQLPASAFENPFKGSYADYVTLATAIPTGSVADYAYVEDEQVFYYWNGQLGSPSWVSQTIDTVSYGFLTNIQKAQVPYIIIPTVV